MGFQGLEFKQPRSGSSATPYTHPESRHAKKKKIRNTYTYTDEFLTLFRKHAKNKDTFERMNEGTTNEGKI